MLTQFAGIEKLYTLEGLFVLLQGGGGGRAGGGARSGGGGGGGRAEGRASYRVVKTVCRHNTEEYSQA